MQGRIAYEKIEKRPKIDKRDRRILSLLAQDARMPLTRIAKQVGLSRDAVDYRIKRLERAGVIIGFFPNINYYKLGQYLFHVFLLVDEMGQKDLQGLLKTLKAHPNVASIIEYSDRWDLEIVVLANDLLAFDQVIMGIAERFPDLILEKDKLEIIKRFVSRHVPPLIDGPHERDERRDRTPVELDEVDRQVLTALSTDCRQSTYRIADTIGVSADTVGNRIKRLEREGVIRNCTVLVNLSLLGYHWYTFSVEMKMFDRANEAKLEEFLDQNRHVLRAAKTLGGWDLLLYVVVENPPEFHRIIKGLKNLFAPIVRNYDTWVAYKEHHFNPFPKVLQ